MPKLKLFNQSSIDIAVLILGDKYILGDKSKSK